MSSTSGLLDVSAKNIIILYSHYTKKWLGRSVLGCHNFLGDDNDLNYNVQLFSYLDLKNRTTTSCFIHKLIVLLYLHLLTDSAQVKALLDSNIIAGTNNNLSISARRRSSAGDFDAIRRGRRQRQTTTPGRR